MRRTHTVVAVALTVALFALLAGPAGAAMKTASGKVTMIRVHEIGDTYGPSSDVLETEVVFKLDAASGMAFGFKLRSDSNLATHQGMLDLLRDALANGYTVYTDYNTDIEIAKKNRTVARIWVTK